MGLKGQRRNNATTGFKEPDLLVNIDSIIKAAQEKGFYRGDSIDIESVIKMFPDIEICYEQMEPNQSGSIKYDDGKWLISVNKHHHKNRQRFTLAHEFGHYILHKDKNMEIVDTIFFRNNDMDSVEYFANEFAAKLLMPKERVEELIKNGIRNIGELSEQFEVSASAMKYRILSMGYKLKDNV